MNTEDLNKKRKYFIIETLVIAVLMGITIAWLISLNTALSLSVVLVLSIWFFFRALDYAYISKADIKELSKLKKL